MSWNFPQDLDSILAAQARLEAKMADLAATLAQIKQSVADFGTDLQGVTQAINDLRSKQASGQQVSDTDVANLQAEAQALQQGHAAIQQLLAQAPAPTAPTTPTVAAAAPAANVQPAPAANVQRPQP